MGTLIAMVGNSRVVGIGRELRLAREAAKLEGRDVAGRLGVAASTISRWETGQRKPKTSEVARYLIAVEAPAELLAELVEDASKPDADRWLAVDLPEHKRQQSAILEFENRASEIIAVSPLLVPGLLQTSEYSRQIMIGGQVPADEIDTRVAVRIGRREVITRANGPVRLTAFIGEAALRTRVGGSGVMVRQLRFLLEEMLRSNVWIGVLPFEAGWHSGLDGMFSLFRASNGDRESVVHLENKISGLFLHEQPEVRRYEAEVPQLEELALSPTASEELIADIINDMETST